MSNKLTRKELKSVIKECIKELLFEDGTLSTIVAEGAKGMPSRPIVEAKQESQKQENQKQDRPNKRMMDNAFKKKASETKEKLLEAIGRDAYKGINVFEGTMPFSERQNRDGSASGPLDTVAPSDPGIDITKIPGMSQWKHLIK